MSRQWLRGARRYPGRRAVAITLMAVLTPRTGRWSAALAADAFVDLGW